MTKTSENTDAIVAAVIKTRDTRKNKRKTEQLVVRSDILAKADAIRAGLPKPPVRIWNAHVKSFEHVKGGPTASEAWKQLSEADKAKFKEPYAEQKRVYDEALAALSAADRQTLETAARLRRRGSATAVPHPKRRRTAYMFFNKDHHALERQKDPNRKFEDVSKAVGSSWKTLNEGDRTPYVKLEDEDRVRYAKDMEAYNLAVAAAKTVAATA